MIKYLKFTLCLFLLLLTMPLVSASDAIPYEEYDDLMNNLASFYRFGYKDNYRGIEKIEEIEQGQLVSTTNALDSAIIGKGFFKVYDEVLDLYFYTRNGQFTLNLERKVSNLDGYTVYPEIQIDSFNFDISQQVQLYLPTPGTAIESSDGVYFLFESDVPLDDATVVSSQLESSNVDLQYSVVRMLEILERLSLEPPRSQPEGLETKQFLLQELFKASIEYPLRFDSSDSQGYFAADGSFVTGASGERIVIRGVTVEVEKQTAYVSVRQAGTYQALSKIVQKTLAFLEI